MPVQVLTLFQNLGTPRPPTCCARAVGVNTTSTHSLKTSDMWTTMSSRCIRGAGTAETTLCPELCIMALFALPTLMSQWLGIIRQNSSLVRHLRTCGACNSLPPLQRRAHPLRHTPVATNGAGRTRYWNWQAGLVAVVVTAVWNTAAHVAAQAPLPGSVATPQ